MKIKLTALIGASCVALVALSSGCSSSSTGASGASGDGGGGGSTGGGTVTTLATGQKNVGGIAVSGNNVAWTTCPNALSNLNGDGNIMTLPVGGGTPVAVATNVDNGALLAIDATNAYWFGPDDDTISKGPLAGGVAPTVLVKGLLNSPVAVAVDATTIYWVTGTGIQSVPIAGGTKTILADNLMLSDVNQQNGIAVSAAGIFATTGDGAIIMVPLAGGTPVTLATGQNPSGIAVDATNVYWSNVEQDPILAGIMKVAVTGGTPVALAAFGSNTEIPFAIAIDSSNVYWIDGIGGGVKKVPISGGTPVKLAASPAEPGGIAVDATSVYWTNTSGGNVYKTAK